MQPDISIIMPVFNGEKYLRTAVESVLFQTVQNKELIVVNDGSTDASADILNEFKKKYPFIVKIIHKKNEGTFLARLDGMKVAKGKYIGFADCDDICRPEMYQKMLNIAFRHDIDIVACNYMEFKNSPNEINKKNRARLNNYQKRLYNSHKILIDTFYFKEELPLWKRIFKQKVIKKTVDYIESIKNFRIRFRGIRNEDRFLFPTLLLNSNTYYQMDSELYYYRLLSTNSITKEIFYKNKAKIEHAETLLKAANYYEDMLYSHGIFDKRIESALLFYEYHCLRYLYNNIKSTKEKFYKLQLCYKYFNRKEVCYICFHQIRFNKKIIDFFSDLYMVFLYIILSYKTKSPIKK